MAADSKRNVNPHSTYRGVAVDWSVDKVVRWLDENGWSSVSRTFKDRNIQGHQFLNLTPSSLNDLLQQSISVTDLVRLHKRIQSLRNDSPPSQYADSTITSYSGGFGRPPQTGTVRSSPPYTGLPSTRTNSNVHAIDSDYAKIRPFIPERTSSNPQQISKIVNQLNYDMSQFRPLYQGRLRSKESREFTPVNGRQRSLSNTMTITPSMTNVSSPRVPTFDWTTAPSSPIPKNEDPKEGWKIAGKRVQQLQDQQQQQQQQRIQPTPPLPKPYRNYSAYPSSLTNRQHTAQRIQITADSETFLSLTVTDIHDPADIKRAILDKLNLKGDHFLYYHENGTLYHHENGDVFYAPLTDEELVTICRNATERLTDQILVVSVDHVRPPYALDGRGIHPDIPSNYGYRYQYHRSYPNTPYTRSEIQQNQHMAYTDAMPGFYHQGSNPQSPTMATSPIGTFTPNNYAPMASRTEKYRDDNNWPTHTSGAASDHSIYRSQNEPKFQLSNGSMVDENDVSLGNPHVLQRTVMNSSRSEQTSTYRHTDLLTVDELGESHGYSRPEQVPRRPQLSQSSDARLKGRWIHRRQYSTDELSMISERQGRANGRATVHFENPEGIVSHYANKNNKNLHIEIPGSNEEGDSALASLTSPLPSSQDQEEETWGERPSIEQLYRDIDKYLPGHDLDKEIFIEPSAAAAGAAMPATSAGERQQVQGEPVVPIQSMAPAQEREDQDEAQEIDQEQEEQVKSVESDRPPLVGTTGLSRRPLGYRKSIRVVAKEAHKNWRHSQNASRGGMVRRRSTKMWDRTVEQVKPGMIVERQTLAAPGPEYPAPTKMQWLRGELIGRGSFGRVYHALNTAAGEWIAVKEVDAPKTKSDMLNSKMKDAVDSLYREISLLKNLEHDNIVQYLGYDYDEDEGHINIFLEYIPGGSILSALNKGGKFEEVMVRFFTRQILLGLEYLHDRNIMHRDIKASNILVDNDGVCKITDFGLSKPSDQEEAYDPKSNTLMKGTVFWMAPEVVKGTSYSAKIDIWSLGCTVIEMLTGKHPWMDMNMLAALYSLGKYNAPPLPEEASETAKDFLNQCFIINADDRPTAAELLVHPFARQVTNFNFQEYMKQRELLRSQQQQDDLDD
ncbi:hypothetical protein BX666DRAFT_1949117 [Dichotomocladium elegans]|nr:hypothetical protein BX666DRAFT_1949117 [Dichotomocladium elegans]